MILPPKGITAVCLIIPSLNIAKSVVPPPISMEATPSSYYSKLRPEIADAKVSRVIPSKASAALLIHLPIFLIDET